MRTTAMNIKHAINQRASTLKTRMNATATRAANASNAANGQITAEPHNSSNLSAALGLEKQRRKGLELYGLD